MTRKRNKHENVDATSRSIATHNVKMAFKTRSDVVFTAWRVSSPVISNDVCRMKLLAEIKSWAHAWERKAGVLVIVEMMVFEEASHSILTILDSTKVRGKQSADQME